MNKIDYFMLLSDFLTKDHSRSSLKQSVSKKIESDSKKMILMFFFSALAVFFLCVSIVLSLYVLIEANTNSVFTDKAIYLIASLFALSIIIALSLSSFFSKKSEEYKELTKKASDIETPIKFFIEEFASQLAKEHHLMTQRKPKKLMKEQPTNWH